MDSAQAKTKQEWEKFAYGDVVNFMTLHNLQQINVSDGCGKKAVVKRGSQGEYKLQVTCQETL